MKIHGEIFSLYKCWKSFVYFVEKEGSAGSTSSAPRDLKFCMLVYIPPKNGITFGAKSSQIFLHWDPPIITWYMVCYEACALNSIHRLYEESFKINIKKIDMSSVKNREES